MTHNILGQDILEKDVIASIVFLLQLVLVMQNVIGFLTTQYIRHDDKIEYIKKVSDICKGDQHFCYFIPSSIPIFIELSILELINLSMHLVYGLRIILNVCWVYVLHLLTILSLW